uniref:Uncharacterized protein n=1 Tax=Arundo donax TaxID=35708 RepID=A0A0A9AIG4_ARUDO
MLILKKKSGEAVNVASDDTPRPADTTPVKPKRGRPPGARSLEKKAAGKNQPSSGLDSKKVEEATDSAGKLTERSAKDDVKSYVRKAGERESSKKHQKSSAKQQKDETLSEEDPAKDLSLKEMVSPKSSTKGPGISKGQGAENSTSKRKREQETEEPPRSRRTNSLDGSLVGARIKIWWPDDKMFYNGVVELFDSVSKRHKVAYDDGDVEVLLLRDEKWEFISEKNGTAMASDTPRGRKRRDSLKEGYTETTKSDGDLPKKRGRPKGFRPSIGGARSNSSSATPSSKVKTASKDAKETAKTGSNLKKEAEKSSKDKATRSTEKTKDELPKDGGEKSASKSKDASNKGKDSKDESKSTEGKGRPGRKPKNAGTPAENEADKEKLKEKEGKIAEIEKASGTASTGKKRRRKA